MPTTTTGDEYEHMLELLESGRLPATVPVTLNGTKGLLTDHFDPSKVDFTAEDAALHAAVVAIRSVYRTARKAGASTKV
jgi:Zn-dependent membrane protease YugP